MAFTFYVSPMPYAFANPQGGVVGSGSANISETGKTLTVDQSTDKAVIDWRSFNINTDETTRFNQPSTTSMTLNRISDVNPSQILGALSANGNVILINPNGILFGQNSTVNVNGLIATTANITNTDFMAGNMNFTSSSSSPTASIINQGTITAADAGLVGLVAPNVTNSGVITARLGKVHLASGNSFTLDMYGDGLMEIGISNDVSSQVVRNTGTINAAGGVIKMTAAAGRQVVNSLIDVQGFMKAPSVAQKNGKIYIYAEGSNGTSKRGSSTVNVSGNLDVSGAGAGETGGEIDIIGDNVSILNGAVLNASGNAGGGKILIGGDYQGGGAANAIHTVIEDGALVTADALSNGNGGKVVAWADDRTNMNGKISAQGGANGGDGGFVETSGKNVLSVGGEVNASSALGAAGSWLLDPNNVIIQAAGSNTNVSGGSSFTTTNDSAIVTTGSIQTALNAGTNVNVLTSSSGTNSQLGNITVASAITKSGGGDATLNLQAVGSIIVNSGANITSTSNKLNIILNADTVGSTTTGGAITITGATLNSNGGNITLGGSANAASAAYGTATYVSGITLSKSTLTSGAGNITLQGTGYSSNAANHYGVNITAGSVVTAKNGNININGVGGKGTTGNFGVYINGANTLVQSTGAGNINITGTGGIGTSSNYGVDVAAGGKINMASTSTGTLTVTGTGSGTTTSNIGILVTGANSAITSNKTSNAGAMNIIGTGANSTGGNIGIQVAAGGVISTTIDNLNITGNGNGTTTGNYGVYVTGANSIIQSTGAGNLTVTGAGGNGTNTNYGVYVAAAGLVTLTSASTGTLTVTGTGGTSGIATTNTTNYGVYVTGIGSAISSNKTTTGTMTVKGTGANGYSSNYGVYVGTGGAISTAADNLSVTGNGGNGVNASNLGVYINGAGAVINSNGAGTVTVTGTGGAGTATNYGVALAAGGQIKSSGNIIVTGVGNGTTTNNYGVFVSKGMITSANGDINVTGTGGNGTTGNYGVYVTGAGGSIQSTGTGNLTVSGTGGNGTSGNYGVYVAAAGLITLTSTSTGSLAVTGVGGAAVGGTTTNYGVFVTGSGSAISSNRTSNAGAMTVTGTGGNGTGSNYGVAVSASGAISTAEDTLIINGIGGDGKSTANYGIYLAGAVTSTGSGNIIINAFGISGATRNATSNAQSIYLTTGAAITSNAGKVTLNTSGVGVINVATAQIIKTAGGDISLNGPITLANTLTLDTTNAGANVVGGNVTFGGTVNGAKAVTVTAGTGGLTTFNGIVGGTTAIGALSVTSGGGVTFNKSIKATSIVADTTSGTTGDITIGSGAVLTETTSNSKTSLVLASGRNFINNSGSGALALTGTSRWLIYSSNPANDALNGLVIPTKRYNKTYAGYAPASVTEAGNVMLYSIAPVITVTASNASKVYGDALPTFTETITGLINGDLASAAYTGTASTPTTAATAASNVGTYGITATGTLAATALGYQIQYVSGSLTVNPATLTVVAAAANKTYGDVNPNLTYTSTGLKFSDTISGKLATSAAATSNVGSYDITQGTVSGGSNYVVNYTGNLLTINPAPVIAPVTPPVISNNPIPADNAAPVVTIANVRNSTPVIPPVVDNLVNTASNIVTNPLLSDYKATINNIIGVSPASPVDATTVSNKTNNTTTNTQYTNTAASPEVNVVIPIKTDANIAQENITFSESKLVSSNYIKSKK